MATTEDYPPDLRRADEQRGRRDGEQRIPSLSEVRRQQQELRETGGQLTVGYQVVLIADFNGELNALFPQFESAGRGADRELRQLEDRLGEAQADVQQAQELLAAASAAVTPTELLPRNFEEQTWDPATLRNRREVERSRRMKRAQATLDAARGRVRQLRAERVAAARRREEALTSFGVRARRLQEVYQRRITTYLDALARHHPDGKTLYPLLAMPELPLPEWVAKALTAMPAENWSET